MANESNLIPFNKQTESEQREIARKGGIKSGEIRRQRKAMKEQMEMLLALPFNLKDDNGNDLVEKLSILGINKEDIDNQMAMIISLWQTAIGDSSQKIQAVKEIREIVQDSQAANSENRIQIINDLPEDDDYGTD